MKNVVAYIVLLGTVTVVAARPPWAGGGGPPGGILGPGGPPAFVRHLFPPPLVMQHQEEIKLDDAQRTAIRQAMQETQTKLVELQWSLDAESEKLGTLLAVERPDEAAVIAQVERVLAIEQEVKKTHLRLLVRIKGQLTPAQQATLRALDAAPGRGPSAPPAP